jgi:hypothetical protein
VIETENVQFEKNADFRSNCDQCRLGDDPNATVKFEQSYRLARLVVFVSLSSSLRTVKFDYILTLKTLKNWMIHFENFCETLEAETGIVSRLAEVVLWLGIFVLNDALKSHGIFLVIRWASCLIRWTSYRIRWASCRIR